MSLRSFTSALAHMMYEYIGQQLHIALKIVILCCYQDTWGFIHQNKSWLHLPNACDFYVVEMPGLELFDATAAA
jgi:hypothetical protein